MTLDDHAGGRDAASDVAWISLGANLGNRRAGLASLRAALVSNRFVQITAQSPEVVTLAVGVRTQPDFRNQVVRLSAVEPLAASAWLDLCQAAERAAGRRPTYRWGPRLADADLLLLGPAGDIRAEAVGVTVPHPEIPHRPFVCALLAAIDPELRHPDGWALGSRAEHLAIPIGGARLLG